MTEEQFQRAQEIAHRRDNLRRQADFIAYLNEHPEIKEDVQIGLKVPRCNAVATGMYEVFMKNIDFDPDVVLSLLAKEIEAALERLDKEFAAL